jgi:predicted cupin superfamily sugar epimerase
MKLHILILAAFLVGCQTVDRGSFGHFDRSLNTKSYGYQVVDDPTGSAPTPKVERFEVRAGDCASDAVWSDCKNDRERSELAQKTQLEWQGASQWYSWSVYFPKDYPNVFPTKVAIGQFYQKNNDAVWMFQQNSNGFWLDDQARGGYTRRYYKLLSLEELRGRWHRIEVNARWSTRDDGFFRVWVNGEQKVDYVGLTMSHGDVYFKYGVYRTWVKRYELQKQQAIPTQIVYFSNVRRASNRDGLQRQ